MRTPTPLVLRLPHAQLNRESSIVALLSRTENASGARLRALLARFEVSPDEKKFVRALLHARANLWIFRSHQAGFCGDFVVVDMSPPQKKKRRVWVCDLKFGGKLRLGGGGAGNQLVRAPQAVDDVAHRTSAIEVGAKFERVVGDRLVMLEYFGVAFA